MSKVRLIAEFEDSEGYMLEDESNMLWEEGIWRREGPCKQKWGEMRTIVCFNVI